MSETRRISITEALNELKLYDAKITKAITNVKYVGATKKSSDKVGVFKRETFDANAKSGYQSVTDLIANRNKLKSAVVQSNAVTEIEVAGKKMTVAEGIERKSSIEYEEALLDELKRQYSSASDTVMRENLKVDNQINKLLEAYHGKDTDKKPSKEDYAAITEPFREKNEFEMVDPINIFDKITKLEEEIDAFKSEIDTRLVLSNAVTFIEV